MLKMMVVEKCVKLVKIWVNRLACLGKGWERAGKC